MDTVRVKPPREIQMLLWLSVMVTGLASGGTGDQLMELQAAPCFPGMGDATMDDCVFTEEQQQRKRTAMPPPCSCVAVSQLQDLGHQYWPRFLPSVECPGTACWRGPYRCRPYHYNVKVLKRRDELSRHRDLSLPEPFRDLWQFVFVKVAVACECSV